MSVLYKRLLLHYTSSAPRLEWAIPRGLDDLGEKKRRRDLSSKRNPTPQPTHEPEGHAWLFLPPWNYPVATGTSDSRR